MVFQHGIVCVERGEADRLVTRKDKGLGRRQNMESTAGGGRKGQAIANRDDLDVVAAVDVNGHLHRAKHKSAVPALLNGHRAAKEQQNEDTVSRKDYTQNFLAT